MSRNTRRRESHRRAGPATAPAPAAAPAAPIGYMAATMVALVALSVFVYSSVGSFPFLSWDDPQYVTQNPHVLAGLTWANAQWAFTTAYASNWHPLTWLSHMADIDMYGLAPGPAHLTNLVLHAATALVLFIILWRMTGAWAPSGVVAALFAVHPSHVESVAWIAERKDVLSTLLWAVTLLAYAAYVRRPAIGRYVQVCACFALALLAKPMVVTLPFVLLLLDVWPLGRLSSTPAAAGSPRGSTGAWGRAGQLVREKIPLFLLAAASSVATFVAQRQGGAVAEFEALPLAARLSNAVVSYAVYLKQLIWPAGLSPFYPYARSTSPALLTGCALVLLIVSALAVVGSRRRPYLLVGWLWYLGTLVPVIGVVQVGSQAMADRYTYIPSIGLFIAVAWTAAAVAIDAPRWRPALIVAAVVTIGAYASVARVQASYWRDNLSLWQRAVDVTATNEVAETGLGVALVDRGRSDEALPHFEAALRVNPAYAFAHNDLGAELRRRRQTADAIAHLSEALRFRPDFPEAANNLGNALADAGRLDEAAARYAEALRLKPDYAEAHNGLGAVLARQDKWDAAIDQFTEAARLQPQSAAALTTLAAALASAGRFDAAARQASQALRLDPQDGRARQLLNDLSRAR